MKDAKAEAGLRISRRDVIVGGAGTLLAIVAHAGVARFNGPSPASLGIRDKQMVRPFKAGRWATCKDVMGMGRGASFDDLEDQLSGFFGSQRGRYLADILVYPQTAAPGWRTREQPLYDQFESIYRRGWSEFDATLADDRRMVVRNYDGYRAAVILGEEGDLQAGALTFDYSPPGGVTNTIWGRSVRAETLWPFSVVLFHHERLPDRGVTNALCGFVENVPLSVVRAESREMSIDGKIRIKIFSREV